MNNKMYGKVYDGEWMGGGRVNGGKKEENYSRSLQHKGELN